MTTMNNTMNTIRKPAYITMRTTVLNGDSWDFLLDISPLAKEEIVPVLSCLVIRSTFLRGRFFQKYFILFWRRIAKVISASYASCPFGPGAATSFCCNMQLNRL